MKSKEHTTYIYFYTNHFTMWWVRARSYSFIIYYLVWLIISLTILAQNRPAHKLGSPCQIPYPNSTGSFLRGICRLLPNCPPVLSDLHAGVKPTICPTRISRAVVCCPNQQRISEKMCNAYKDVLSSSAVIKASPLLPLDFLESEPKEASVAQCEVFGNGLIAGGRNAKEEEFPHMAALGWGQAPESLEFRCGAALISDNFVITAAHCVNSRAPPSYVLLGDIRLKPLFTLGRSVMRIAQIIKHPDYRSPIKYNDIALIRLEVKLNLSRAVRPACLPQPRLRLEAETSLSTAGWGKVGFDGPSDILQTVDLTRFGVAECNELYNNPTEKALKYRNGIVRSQICAGSRDGKDTCNGDSGGPLTATDKNLPCVHYVVGLTSFGALVCGYTPGIYTNVQSFLPWIEQIVWPND